MHSPKDVIYRRIHLHIRIQKSKDNFILVDIIVFNNTHRGNNANENSHETTHLKFLFENKTLGSQIER